jgi:hypothetical protein
VADFLLYLFNEKKLGPSAIEGYRTAINSMWRLTGRTLEDHFAITSLLKTFRAERPRTVHTFPKWDLALVLRVLSKAPFEPLSDAAPLQLTRKTLFLLLLASARRVGDIHAIDPHRVIIQKKAVILQPVPGYLPKISSTAEGNKRYVPIVIRKLSSFASDAADLTLCPVRALLLYQEFAKKRLPNRDRFWCTLKSHGRPVKKQTLSGWIVGLIRQAYYQASEEDCRLSAATTHEVRALAASLCFQATFSLSTVLETATWAHPTTFTDFYLRDVSRLQGRLHTIGPCVVAGRTFN